MWNCVPGNTINTVCALSHQKLFTSNQNSDSILTKAIMPTAQMIKYTLPAVVHALKHHGYSTAMTRKMTQNNSMELNDLELHINTHKFPMLIVLNMEYSGEQWRQHLIGIVPVNIGDEIQMHIVDGCHPNQKSIPLNEENFRWCCSGCISFYVEQFAVLVPGKKSIYVLRKHYSNRSGNGSQPFYQTTTTTKELLEAIPNAYQPKKRKRLQEYIAETVDYQK